MTSAAPETKAAKIDAWRDGEGGKTQADKRMPLGFVLQACPNMLAYAPGGQIADWPRFVEIAGIIRSMLGISPDAWDEAVQAMGSRDAAVAVAAILQKGEAIRSPGGYLRVLSRKAREQAFSVGPILMALLNTGLKQRKRS